MGISVGLQVLRNVFGLASASRLVLPTVPISVSLDLCDMVGDLSLVVGDDILYGEDYRGENSIQSTLYRSVDTITTLYLQLINS